MVDKMVYMCSVFTTVARDVVVGGYTPYVGLCIERAGRQLSVQLIAQPWLYEWQIRWYLYVAC